MHNMSTTMNKKDMINLYPETVLNASNPDDKGTNKTQNVSVVHIEKENRLSKIISLYSKGHTESEIAERVGVDQSIVSRDL